MSPGAQQCPFRGSRIVADSHREREPRVPRTKRSGKSAFPGETVKSDRLFLFYFAACETIVWFTAALRFGNNLLAILFPSINLLAVSCDPLTSWARSECLLSLGGRARSSINDHRVTLARIMIRPTRPGRDHGTAYKRIDEWRKTLTRHANPAFTGWLCPTNIRVTLIQI